jgi:phospholipid/cholesterol/gamma-HCH transport system substrate-binding protein
VPTEEKTGSRAARYAALAAAIGAVVLLALLFFAGGGGYTVKARFINAGQLVRGSTVDVGGVNAGSVKGFEITDSGQVDVELEVDDRYTPLREGTRAVIRQNGLGSPASRYVQLLLPPEDQAGDDIEDGGRISIDKTTTNVELDQFFSIFDRRTRQSLRDFYRGGARQYGGRGADANRGFRYLSPQLAASSRLFEELTHDDKALERFLVDSSRFVTALAERRDDLAPLIANLNATTRALGDEKLALAEAIERLPPFMRQANTTYVNLRSTLDALDPFVEASKPVARKLRPYLAELRPFSREAVPVIRGLDEVVGKRGRDNDLLELNRTYPPLEDIALVTKERNGEERRGAFPEMTQAFSDSAPIVAHGRPYTVDLLGWFDDFSHTGAFDALGSFSRVQTYFNQFIFSQGIPDVVGGFVPIQDRDQAFQEIAKIRQVKRCPGASEEAAPDGSNVFSEEEQRELDCVDAHRATGPIQ